MKKELKLILMSFCSVLLFGTIAHGYRFSNMLLSHDALNEFSMFDPVHYASGSVWQWKISLGRFIEPAYQYIFHGPTLSIWLIGLLSLLWISLTAYLVCKIFSIVKPLYVALTAGILTVNITVIALTATYIQDLDADMFAVLLAVCAVYFWNKSGWKRLLAIPFMVCTLGIYQCMISVAIVLIMFKCIIDLMEDSDASSVIKKGLIAIGLLVASGLIYMIIVKVTCSVFNIAVGSGYNGLTNIEALSKGAIIPKIVSVYKQWFSLFIKNPAAPPVWFIAAINVAVLILTAVLIVIGIVTGKRKPLNAVLIILLVLLLPLGMNLSDLLNNDTVHHLMIYSFWLLYLLPLLILIRMKDIANFKIKKYIGGICFVLIALMLFANIRTSNAAYVKKNLEEAATLSAMTRVADDIEKTDGYVSGKTKVLFVGSPQTNTDEYYESLSQLTGMAIPATNSKGYIPVTSAIPKTYFYSSYFKIILGRSINVCTWSNCDDFESLINKYEKVDMPLFPEDGYIKKIDDMLVVKISNAGH